MANAYGILKEFNEKYDLGGCILLSSDGLVINAVMPGGIYADTMAIMVATIGSAARTILSELKAKELNYVVIGGADGTHAIIMGRTRKQYLVAVTERAPDKSFLQSMKEYAQKLT